MVLNRCAEEGLFAKGGLGRRVFLAQWGACRIAVSGAVCLLPYVLYGAWDEELIGLGNIYMYGSLGSVRVVREHTPNPGWYLS